MKKLKYLIFLIFLSKVWGEELTTRQHSFILESILYSPELIYKTTSGVVEITPKESTSLGISYSYYQFMFSYRGNLLGLTPKASSGLEFTYHQKKWLIQFFHMQASHYNFKLKLNQGGSSNIANRSDISSQSNGLIFIRAFDGQEEFSLGKALRGLGENIPNSEAKRGYIYSLYVDSSAFKGDSELTPYESVKEKDRLALAPGFGLAFSQASASGYGFAAVTMGVGYLDEKRVQTNNTTEKLKNGAYDILGLVSFVLHKSKPSSQSIAAISEPEVLYSHWFGGMSGTLHILQPMDETLIGQRNFLINAFVGAYF